jgi:hypothetical protein
MPPNAFWLCRMGREFSLPIAMEERSLPKLRQIRQSPDWCTSLSICRTLEKMKLLTEIASQATSQVRGDKSNGGGFRVP